MGQLLGFALDFLTVFADAIVGVFQWSGRNNELASRVEPPRDRPAASEVTRPPC